MLGKNSRPFGKIEVVMIKEILIKKKVLIIALEI